MAIPFDEPEVAAVEEVPEETPEVTVNPVVVETPRAMMAKPVRQARPAAMAKPADPMQELMAPSRKAMRHMRQAGEAGIKAEEAKQAEAAPLEAEFAKITAEHQKAVEARSVYRAKMLKDVDTMETMANRLAAEQPRDAWAEASTGLKIGSIIAIGLGAAAQSFYGDKTNVVADQINAALERDIMFQKLRLQKGKDDFQNKGLLLRQFMDTSDHIQDAEDKTYVTAAQGIMQRMEMMKKRVTSPQMQAALDQNMAEMEMRVAERQERLQVTMAGHDKAMADGELSLALKKAELANKIQGLGIESQKEADRQRNLMAPGIEGRFKDPEDRKEYEKKEALASTIVKTLDDAVKLLANRKITDLASIPEWNQLKSNLNLLAKGEGGFNLGAALSPGELSNLESAIGTGNLNWLRSEAGIKALRKAQTQVERTFGDYMKAKGVRPSRQNPIFQAPEEE